MQKTSLPRRSLGEKDKDKDGDRFLFLVSTSVGPSGKEQYDKDMRARAHAARRSHASRRAEPSLSPTGGGGGGAVEPKQREVVIHARSVSASASARANIARQQQQFRVNAAPNSPFSQSSNRPPGPWTRSAVDNGNDEPFNQISVPDLPRYVISVLHDGEYSFRQRPLGHSPYGMICLLIAGSGFSIPVQVAKGKAWRTSQSRQPGGSGVDGSCIGIAHSPSRSRLRHATYDAHSPRQFWPGNNTGVGALRSMSCSTQG